MEYYVYVEVAVKRERLYLPLSETSYRILEWFGLLDATGAMNLQRTRRCVMMLSSWRYGYEFRPRQQELPTVTPPAWAIISLVWNICHYSLPCQCLSSGFAAWVTTCGTLCLR